jgi:type IV secretory pathway VirB10-like protein
VGDTPAGKEKRIESPTELDTGDFIHIRGRILGAGKIGKRPGLIVLAGGALLVAAIAYGISYSGVRTPIVVAHQAPIAIANDSDNMWWHNQSDALPVASPSETPKMAATTASLDSGVPNLDQGRDLTTPMPAHPTYDRNAIPTPYPVTDFPAIPPLSDLQQADPTPTYDDASPSRSLGPSSQDSRLRDALHSQPLVGSVETSDGVDRLGVQGNNAAPGAEIGVRQTGDLHSVASAEQSPYTITEGTVIPAALVTAIDSDLPGLLIAQTREDVYDSSSGRYLVIPQGAKLIGSYDARIVYGQERLLVTWIRLILPNGSTFDLGNMAGADAAGRSGFDARVDNHTGRLLAGVMLMSIIGAGAQLSQPSQPLATGSAPNVGQVVAGSVGSQIAGVSSSLAQRQLNAAPNLRVNAGYEFNVVVDHDIGFSRPYIGP